MKLYHCFRNLPKDSWNVWLPELKVSLVDDSDKGRLAEYLAEQAEYGCTPDAYYCSKEPLFGYGPIIQEIEIDEALVFNGVQPGEYIIPSDQVDNYKLYFYADTDYDMENPGLPEWAG